MDLQERLFQAMELDLRSLRPDLAESILCALCCRRLDRDALTTREVTKEHVLPLSLGGKRLTLTCQPCNNVLGSKIDADFVNLIAAREANMGYGTIPGTLDIAGNRLAIDFKYDQIPREQMNSLSMTRQPILKLSWAAKRHFGGSAASL